MLYFWKAKQSWLPICAGQKSRLEVEHSIMPCKSRVSRNVIRLKKYS